MQLRGEMENGDKFNYRDKLHSDRFEGRGPLTLDKLVKGVKGHSRNGRSFSLGKFLMSLSFVSLFVRPRLNCLSRFIASA